MDPWLGNEAMKVRVNPRRVEPMVDFGSIKTVSSCCCHSLTSCSTCNCLRLALDLFAAVEKVRSCIAVFAVKACNSPLMINAEILPGVPSISSCIVHGRS